MSPAAFGRPLAQAVARCCEALAPILQGGSTKAPFTFSRLVTRNLFGHESGDPVVALTIGTSGAAALFSLVDALKEVLPRTTFS